MCKNQNFMQSISVTCFGGQGHISSICQTLYGDNLPWASLIFISFSGFGLISWSQPQWKVGIFQVIIEVRFFKEDNLCGANETYHYLYPSPPPHTKGGGVLKSLCQSGRVSDCVCLVSPEPLNHFFTKSGTVVYYHQAMCHAKKLVHHLQCQGHSEHLHNQNMTIFYYIF